jgi:hypothetical protein
MLRGSEAVAGSSPEAKKREPEIRPGGVGEALLDALSGDTFPPALEAAAAAASSSSGHPSGVNMETLMAQVAQLTACVIQLTELQKSSAVAAATSAAAATPELQVQAAAMRPAAGDQETVPMDTSTKAEAHIEHAAEGRKLSAKILAILRSEGAKFGKRLRSAHATLALKAKIETLLADLKKGVVPTGMNPYKPSSDVLYSEAIGEVVSELPYGMRGDATLDEVRRKLHVEHVAANLVVDLRFLQLKQASLKRSCSLDAYLLEC